MNLSHHLLIFTRYPEIGKTKTRLIPLLGAKGAADLHRTLTEQTVSMVKQQQQTAQIKITIHFSGGNHALMQNWLGTDLEYCPQSHGDLGQKMQQAVLRSFSQGASRVIIIGTDCPDLTGDILETAFQSLENVDIAIGPAQDGGYYLLGLRYPIPELFDHIDWGTERVLTQTQTHIAQKHYKTYYLPVLRDIDRPEDWLIWIKTKDSNTLF
jgi:rSAM/selenodomain-associated transferase 1